MKILGFKRLDSSISTGLVIKILLETRPGEVEHALHILLNGSIFLHEHSENSGISEGYRVLNLERDTFSSWSVVGAGFPIRIHGVPYKEGLQIVEGSKRGPGKDCWPELSID